MPHRRRQICRRRSVRKRRQKPRPDNESIRRLLSSLALSFSIPIVYTISLSLWHVLATRNRERKKIPRKNATFARTRTVERRSTTEKLSRFVSRTKNDSCLSLHYLYRRPVDLGTSAVPSRRSPVRALVHSYFPFRS